MVGVIIVVSRRVRRSLDGFVRRGACGSVARQVKVIGEAGAAGAWDKGAAEQSQFRNSPRLSRSEPT